MNIIFFYAVLLCSLSQSISAEQSIQIDIPINTHPMTVKHGEIFTINLPSNPSTGYTNIISRIDPSFIKEIKKEFKPKQTKRGIVGAGGIDTFTFKAIKEGETKIMFEYVRPWEKPLEPARRDIYMVTIQ